MYGQFFGLQREPFRMTPDPAVLYLTPAHREALAGLMYAVLGRKGFVALTGEAGTGKTTLLARLQASVPSSRAQFAVVLNPTLTRDEFLEMALIDFGLKEVPVNKTQRLLKLQGLLLDAERQNKVSILIIDEAHKLSSEVLEEIRLLSNFEHPEGKLLQIVLAGQPELKEVLNRQDLRQLKQRIAVRLDLRPLSAAEVSQYLHYRWMKAGGVDPLPFAEALIPHIAQHARGIPRLVNAICDNALVMAFSEGVGNVSLEHIDEAARDLDLMHGQNPMEAKKQESVSAGRVPAVQAPVTRPAGNAIEPVQPSGAAGMSYVPTLERHAPAAKAGADSLFWKRFAGKLGLRSSRTEIYE